VTTVASETADPSRSYRQPIDHVIAALGTNVQHGLGDGEARSRLQQHGRNELVAEKPLPAWRRLLAQFQDVLVVLLLVATAISAGLWAYERDAALPYEAIAIFAVVLLNATMGYIQESRAEAAVVALRAMSAADATVIRDGRAPEYPGHGLGQTSEVRSSTCSRIARCGRQSACHSCSRSYRFTPHFFSAHSVP
jgi:Ca2+-transporting ATPase